VEIVVADVVVCRIANAMAGKATLPDGEFGGEPMGEAAFDELHRSLDCDVGWGDEEVEVIGHDDVGVQEIRALLSNVAIKKGLGRPKSVESQVAKPKKRRMSAKGRAAISAAMKARWAKARATKSVTKKAATKSKN
jgi:hypothetical protein